MRQKQVLAVGSYLALLILLLAYFPVAIEGIDEVTVLAILVISATAIAIHLGSNCQTNWMRIDTLFIIGIVVVSFQWPVMYAVFNFTPPNDIYLNSLEQHGNHAIILSSIALIAWLIGFSLAQSARVGDRIDYIGGHRLVGYLLFISLFVFAVLAGSDFFQRTVHTVYTEGREQTVDGLATYALDVLELFARLSLSFVLYYCFVLLNRKTLISIFLAKKAIPHVIGLIAFVVVFLIAGERGQVVMILLGFVLGYAKMVRPIGMWEFLVLIASGFTAMSLIAIFRSGVAISDVEILASYGIWEVTTNLANSTITVTQAIEMVKSGNEFFLGQVWVSQILGVFPFLQGIFLSLTGISLSEVSSGVAITHFTLGPFPHTGLGTSFVADIYLATGIGGLLVVPALFGVVCKVADQWLNGKYGFLRFHVAMVFGGLIIYITRSSVLFQLKPVLWGVAAIVLLMVIRRIPIQDIR